MDLNRRSVPRVILSWEESGGDDDFYSLHSHAKYVDGQSVSREEDEETWCSDRSVKRFFKNAR